MNLHIRFLSHSAETRPCVAAAWVTEPSVKPQISEKKMPTYVIPGNIWEFGVSTNVHKLFDYVTPSFELLISGLLILKKLWPAGPIRTSDMSSSKARVTPPPKNCLYRIKTFIQMSFVPFSYKQGFQDAKMPKILNGNIIHCGKDFFLFPRIICCFGRGVKVFQSLYFWSVN